MFRQKRSMDPSNSPLRYPGGKGRLSGFIRQIFEDNELLDGHYVEPYAGGAGLALNLLFLDYASCIHLNDIDRSVFAFWHSVVNSPDALCKLIRDTPVTVDQWQKQKVIHRSPDKQSLLDLGFATFFLNRCNRSGILMGGIIGGQKQEGTWKIDARYNKSDLCRRIEKIALCRSRIRLYNLDAAALITGVVPGLPQKSLVYLDPPYYIKADGLYKNHYSHADHVAIAGLVKSKIKVPWVVSYDNAPEIGKLYRGCKTIVYDMSYSAAAASMGSEVMFFSKGLVVPQTANPSTLRAA